LGIHHTIGARSGLPTRSWSYFDLRKFIIRNFIAVGFSQRNIGSAVIGFSQTAVCLAAVFG